jgi:hypothetical protein
MPVRALPDILRKADAMVFVLDEPVRATRSGAKGKAGQDEYHRGRREHHAAVTS